MVTARKVRFELPAAAESVRLSRCIVKAILHDWRSRVDPDVVELLTSELVTNALLHGVPPELADTAQITVDVSETPGGLQVEIHDPGRGAGRQAAPTQAAAHDENGRGLTIVGALAASWGETCTLVGRSVYFVVLAPMPTQEKKRLAEAQDLTNISAVGGRGVARPGGRGASREQCRPLSVSRLPVDGVMAVALAPGAGQVE
ncbi:MAG TPA: ATP-binding protein [Actinocrinis sp.]|nr:ATP-binding protein [Actinocrinis sp.]